MIENFTSAASHLRFAILIFLMLFLGQGCRPAHAALSINNSNPTDWVISNGTLTLHWNPVKTRIFGVYLNGVNLVDQTSGNEGLYMDNTGVGGGAVTTGFHQEGNRYIDWWKTVASNAKNPFTYTQHYILTDHSSGFSVYFVGSHSPNDPPGGLGQIQYVFRISQPLFDTTYSVNPDLKNLGVTITPLPVIPASAYSDPGRNVQNACLDLHGLPLPAGYRREFDTKYDYSSYEYLHKVHGVYGTQYAAWTVIPSTDTLVGGPTKQDLIFTGNILMMECQSNHLDNGLFSRPPAGVNYTRIFGPYFFDFNQFDATHRTPASLCTEALNAEHPMQNLYNYESVLLTSGYVPTTERGTVRTLVQGGGSPKPQTAWVVLSDNQKNFQYSSIGHEYWASSNAKGHAQMSEIVPGTYRLSAYVLGKWGEARYDNIAVHANQTTALPSLKFVPENFGTKPVLWTIGTPDRSAHEFLHGHTSVGRDDREFQGTWNFWKDFAANKGAVIYNATNGPGYKATDNPDAWNYVQWGAFNPGLYAGVYNKADDSTDGYKYICPAYVGNPATAKCPPWQVHFTTTPAQRAQGQYAVLSVGLASTESSVIVSLNGHTLIFHEKNRSDAMLRSGLAGYYQWFAMQWPTADLAPAGQDNVMTFSVNQTVGVMYDALRFEITSTSAAPAVRGWHDYDFISGSTYVNADDSLPNP